MVLVDCRWWVGRKAAHTLNGLRRVAVTNEERKQKMKSETKRYDT